MNEEPLSQALLDLIYGSALGQNTWQDILLALERSFPGVRFALWGHDLRSNQDVGRRQVDHDTASIRNWTGYSPPFDARVAGLERSMVGIPQLAERLLPRAGPVARQYGAYREVPQEEMPSAIGLTMYSDTDRFFTLSAHGRVGNDDQHKGALGQLLRDLGPHLARAFALTRAMRQAVAPHELENAIESVGTAALLLDVGGRTVGRNRNAEQLLADCPVVSIDQLGRLRLAGADAQQQLDRLLVRLENDDRFRLPDAIALGNTHCGKTLVLRFVPFRTSAVELDPAGLFAAPDRPVLLVSIEIEPLDAEQRAARMLSARFGLSEMECSVALELCRGERLEAIAERRQVTLHAVRKQLRSVFTKTKASSQSQLVALTLRLVLDNG